MRSGDWVPCSSYGVPIILTPAGAPLRWSLDLLLLSTGPDRAADIGEVASVETETFYWVERVVGQILFTCTTQVDERVVMHERLRVGIRNDAGVGTFFALTFDDAEDANEPFLWERVSHIATGALVPSLWPEPHISHPGYSMVDCHSKRSLGRAEALYYSVRGRAPTTGELGAGDTLVITPYLRCWAGVVAGGRR